MRTILFALLILPFFSFSQEWSFIGTSNKSNYYIRKKTSQSEDNKYWIKEVAPKLDYKTKSGKKVVVLNGYRLTLYDFDCSDRRLQLIQNVLYNSLGKNVFSYEKEDWEDDWSDVIPDTLGEFFLNTICDENIRETLEPK